MRNRYAETEAVHATGSRRRRGDILSAEVCGPPTSASPPSIPAPTRRQYASRCSRSITSEAKSINRNA